MKAIKRTIAGLLATLMFVSCFSFNFAFGATASEDEIAVSKVNAAGIMTGTDNGFEPTKTLTRAEAAAIVVRMKGVPESQVEGAKGNTLFSDVPASNWAAGYINAASSMSIISGVGNGLFEPNREVTIVEFIAMATRALGAGKLVDSMGTWPTNYVNFASEEKLLEGVLKVYTAPATRMDVAYMVVNTIEAPMWEKKQVTNTNEVTYVKQELKTILTDVLEITVIENDKLVSVDTKEREVVLDSGEFVNYDIVDSVELATLKAGMEVDVWAKADDKEIIRIAPAEKAKIATVNFTGIEKIDTDANKITFIVGKDSEEKYTYEEDVLEFSFNTAVVPSNVVESTGVLTNEEGASIAKNEDIFGTAIIEGNKVTKIYAEAYLNRGVVEEVKNKKLYFESASDVLESTFNSSIDTDDEDLEFVVTKDKKEISVEDIEEGDAVYFYVDSQDDDRYVMVVNNYTVEGEAKQVSADKYVKIDGTKYELAPAIEENGVDITAGDEVKLYLNGRGEIIMYEMIDGAVDSTVAMVKSFRAATNKYDETEYEIVLVQLDGTELDTKVVDTEESFNKFENFDEDLFDDEDDVIDAITEAGLKGSLVRYTIKSGKVVIREFFNGSDVVTSYSEDKIEAFDGADYDKKSGRLTGESAYRLNSNTIIYLVKPESGSKADYSVKLEEVKFADLGSRDDQDLEGFVFNVNEDTMVVDAVVFTSAVTRSKDNNYAIVLDVVKYDGNEDEEDYPEQATLLLSDGSVVEVLVHEDYEEDLTNGMLIEAYIKDDKLDEATLQSSIEGIKANENVNVYSFNGDGTIKFLRAGSTECANCGEADEDACTCDVYTATAIADPTCANCGEADEDACTCGYVDADGEGAETVCEGCGEADEDACTCEYEATITADPTCVNCGEDDEDACTCNGHVYEALGAKVVKEIVDNCIFVKYTEDGEYVKGSESKVPEIATSVEVYSDDEEVDVTIYVVENEDGIEEIVAMMYNEVK